MKTYSLAAAAMLLVAVSSCKDAIHEAYEAKMAELPQFASVMPDVASLKGDQRRYVEFLYAYMPLPDMAVHGFDYWNANAAKAIEVRKRMGWNVPEREFRHFVLPVRVNNEYLDDFRTLHADELCSRVEGMSMADAVLEINHWCHEQATYKPSDERTQSPLATMRLGTGRCGEESVLAVAALRAVGIPARQVYTPRWAHTDDNHAWVEAYVDGSWHFLGACEPEPTLDMAWFNAPVSRAMLLHTKVFGDYHGDEDVITHTEAYTEINVIRGYVGARRTEVTVLDTLGRAVEGAEVEFRIYNYAEMFPVAAYLSDVHGRAALDTGLGDVLVWASKDDMFGVAVASSEHASVVLDHHFGEEFGLDLDIVPPAENPIPSSADEGQIEANAVRLAYEDSLRLVSALAFESEIAALDLDPVMRTRLEQTRNNWRAWKGFFDACEGDARAEEITATVFDSVSEKDLWDVQEAVLTDALKGAGASLSKWVVDPRVESELLLPYREEILSGLEGTGLEQTSDVNDVIAWINGNVTIDAIHNPQRLRMPPVSVWRYRVCDRRSRDIFFVALCRTLGIASRYDRATGKVQYLADGAWTDVDFEVQVQRNAPQGFLSLVSEPGVRAPMYYTHYTLSNVRDGSSYLFEIAEDGSEALPESVDAGYYLVTSGRRMADGSVLAHLDFFNVNEGVRTERPLVLRPSEGKVAVIGSMDAEQLFMQDGESVERSILSATGRGYFLIAVLGSNEPSNHAVRQLASASDVLNAWGRKLVILAADGRGEGLSGTEGLADLDNAVYGRDVAGKVQQMLLNGMESASPTLPVVVVADSFGRIVYFSQGYNTSLAENLASVINNL